METSQQFEEAKRIAFTAAALDWKKNSFPEEARFIASMCVNNLHDLAEKLAGDQVTKLYTM